MTIYRRKNSLIKSNPTETPKGSMLSNFKLAFLEQRWGCIKLKNNRHIMWLSYSILLIIASSSALLTFLTYKEGEVFQFDYFGINPKNSDKTQKENTKQKTSKNHQWKNVINIETKTKSDIILKKFQISNIIPKGKYKIYYKLTNFYQNNRDYYKNYSPKQFKGTNPKYIKDLGNCSSFKTYKGKTIYPCGAIANSFFNDRFKIFHLKENSLENNSKEEELFLGISFDDNNNNYINKDKEIIINKKNLLEFNLNQIIKDFTKEEIDENEGIRKTKRFDIKEMELPLPSNIDFQIWMKPSPTKDLVKLYGNFELKEDLKENTFLYFLIEDNFDANVLEGSKSIIISSKKDLKNYITIIFIHGIAILLVLVMFFTTNMGLEEGGEERLNKYFQKDKKIAFY